MVSDGNMELGTPEDVCAGGDTKDRRRSWPTQGIELFDRPN
jgi:hypothetical protein